MRSMTGYGKGTASSAGLTVTAEIKTVNHKFFDWNMKMPKGFLFVEDDAKKAVAGAVSRGHVDLYLTVEKQTAEAGEYRADAALARMYVDSARQLSETLGVPFDITASSLMKNPDIVTLSETEIDDETVRKVTLEAVSEAVSALVAMREREGAALAADLSEKLASIEASLEEEDADDLCILRPEVAQGAYVVFLVDDEHGDGADDVEAGYQEDEGEEEVGDELLHFHDAEHVFLLFVAVLHGEVFAQQGFDVAPCLADVGALFQLQFDGRHPSLLPEEVAGEAQGGEDVVGIVFGLLHGEDHAGGI